MRPFHPFTRRDRPARRGINRDIHTHDRSAAAIPRDPVFEMTVDESSTLGWGYAGTIGRDSSTVEHRFCEAGDVGLDPALGSTLFECH